MVTPHCPIIATLGYVLSPDRSHTLLVHRIARGHDHHLGKYNGLGGKMHPDENIIQCMRREIREEAGIECRDMVLRGTINWTGFGAKAEDWFGFIFRIDRFSGVPLTTNSEGSLSWHPIKDILSLPLWPGDRFFLPMVFDDNPAVFHGWMPYCDGEPTDWRYERL